jgi:Fur family ferric uptake transcriptional regulator
VTEIKSDLISDTIDEMHLKRFRKDGFTLYIYGICSTCSARMTRQKKKASEKSKKLNKI